MEPDSYAERAKFITDTVNAAKNDNPSVMLLVSILMVLRDIREELRARREAL